jgi:hypothetical protein
VKGNIIRESGGLRLEACNCVSFSLGEIRFSLAQGIFGSVKSLSKIFDTNNIFLSLFASFLAGALLNKMQRF